MEHKKANRKWIAAIALGALMAMSAGCGGSGGGGAAAGAATGKVAARITLTRPAGAARAAQQSTDPITVVSVITGVYSGSGDEFSPVTGSTVLDSSGSGVITAVDVPTGVNHLLTLTVDWGEIIETIRAIIPEVETGEITTVVGDHRSTAIADAAILYAEQHDTQLYLIASGVISGVTAAVDILSAAGFVYEDMTPGQVLEQYAIIAQAATLTISPDTAELEPGDTLQFTATALDGSAQELPGAALVWSFSAETVGSVDASGLFTAAADGTGTLTVTYGALTTSASITVVTPTPPPSPSVTGTVMSDGAPVADAVVHLYNDSYSDTTLTDANGQYSFYDVPSGSYYIVATKQGFTLESSTVTVP